MEEKSRRARRWRWAKEVARGPGLAWAGCEAGWCAAEGHRRHRSGLQDDVTISPVSLASSQRRDDAVGSHVPLFCNATHSCSREMELDMTAYHRQGCEGYGVEMVKSGNFSGGCDSPATDDAGRGPCDIAVDSTHFHDETAEWSPQGVADDVVDNRPGAATRVQLHDTTTQPFCDDTVASNNAVQRRD